MSPMLVDRKIAPFAGNGTYFWQLLYILANMKKGALYVGAAPALIKRVWELTDNSVDGFTKRYRIPGAPGKRARNVTKIKK